MNVRMLITVKNGRCEVLSLHTPSVAADYCQLSTIQLQQNRKNLESRTSEVLSKDGKQRVLPFYHVALHVSSFVDFLVNCHELHQESFHCHQLEEELDDECHCWYFQNGTGLSCRSPILGVDGVMWTTPC